jgi:hypothetical protein
MNKKMIISGISIFSALALMGGAAFAQYALTASASSNTFASGTASLELCNDDGSTNSPATDTSEVCGTSITSPIADLTDLVPGVTETIASEKQNGIFS